jgi:hypothetical protein
MVGRANAAGYRADQGAKKAIAFASEQPGQGSEITPRSHADPESHRLKIAQAPANSPTPRRRMNLAAAVTHC